MRTTIVAATLGASAWAAGVELAVDANRDGVVVTRSAASPRLPEDRTAPDKPFLFWLNDDQDDKAYYESWPVRKPDRQDGVIRSARDLEDFARLHVRLPPGARGDDQLVFSLEALAGEPAIRIFPSEDARGRDLYLTAPDGGARQIAQPWNTALGVVSPRRPLTVYAATANGGRLRGAVTPLLFEGAGRGTGVLTVTHVRGGRAMRGSAQVHLEIRHVKEMYGRVNAPWPLSKKPWDVLDASPEIPDLTWHDDPMGRPFRRPWDEEPVKIVWVYGWLKQGDENYRMATVHSGETIFKRLWHRGYRGRLIMFRWETRKHTLAMGLKQSEYRAYKFGPVLRDHVATLPENEQVFVTAHSLGNVVLLEALKVGLDCDAVLFQQAAVPASAFDPNPDLALPAHRGQPASRYAGYLADCTVPIYSLYNAQDATWLGWNIVQEKFKPHSEWTKKYKPSPEGGAARLKYWWFFERPVTDPHEQLAFVERARTNALGAEARTAGAVRKAVDLDGRAFRFGSGHVSQWSLNPQRTTVFYNLVLDLLGQPYVGAGQ